MPGGKLLLTIDQGATFDVELQWLDATGSKVDLTGMTAALEIRNAPGGNVLHAQLTSSNIARGADVSFLSMSGSLQNNPPTSGSIGIYIGHEVTDGFTFKDGYYDLEVTSGTERYRILEGKVCVTKQVTTAP